MNSFPEKILSALANITSSGSFVTKSKQAFVYPSLEIKDVDEIAFPINRTQIQAMIKVARKAPFGKGSKTVLDTTVRSAWEIDASQINFNNANWQKLIHNIINNIKPELGLEGKDIDANLYKLLIYEEGDFFLAHKDSEKEKGMFGTLIVGLPSKHTGGDLHVRFEGREEIISFADNTDFTEVPYVAFYADCEHEIKPITTGTRVCLVYNLIQTKDKNQRTPLTKDMMQVCKENLIDRIENKPQPPSNWTREVPVGTSYKKVWDILKSFIESPTMQTFDYARVQAERTEMERAIGYVTIDLRTETIRKGSPHTLRIIKTQNAYEKDLKKWQFDVDLLKKVELW